MVASLCFVDITDTCPQCGLSISQSVSHSGSKANLQISCADIEYE